MGTQNSSFWKRGEKTALARAAGLSGRQVLNDFIAGRFSFTADRARSLEAATRQVLGADRVIPATAWLRLTEHVALVKGA